MDTRIAKVLAIAAQEVGVREVGNSNTGARVREYQAATTLGGSYWPWCAAFIAWCIMIALGKELARKVWLNSASCDFILDWARRLGIISTTPKAGCCGLVMAGKNDATHIFFVEAIDGDTMTTIEGNTNTGGSRNGNGVYRRKRKLSSRYLYVIFEELLPDEGGKPKTYELRFAGKKADDLPVFDGRAYCPAWKWAHWMGAQLGWNMEAQTVTLNGREVPSQPRILNERAYLPIRELVAFSGLKLSVNDDTRVIEVTR